MVAQAGVRTLDIQAAAKAENLLYAGDPSSSDSCQIGGNLATNAGGIKAVRYGVTRNQVYAVQIVTPYGDIVDLGSPLKSAAQATAWSSLLLAVRVRWVSLRR